VQFQIQNGSPVWDCSARGCGEAHALDMRGQACLRGRGDAKGASGHLSVAHAFQVGYYYYYDLCQTGQDLDAECFDEMGSYKNALVGLRLSSPLVKKLMS